MCRRTREFFSQPARYHGSNLRVVLFQHHHVAIASDADISKFDPGGLNTGLLKVFDRAMVVRRMIGRFRRENQDRKLRQIGKKPAGRLLHPTFDEVGPIWLVLSHGDKIGRLASRRLISERYAGDPPNVG